MRIKEKINMDLDGLKKNGPISIVAFGDSITHGAFGPDEFDYESVYWNLLRKKINEKRNYVPVNVINAGIGGVTATDSVNRVESQVLSHRPDLVIVCFGLNDVNGELEDYLTALQTIFDRIVKSGAEIIFMTPNMLNTSIAEDTPSQYLDYARKTARFQNDGKMDLFMDGAICLAQKTGVKVCDCYHIWKDMSKTQDITKLLANRINHPIKEMHALFSDELMRLIFEESDNMKDNDSTMFCGG